jgi:hypothetical protein
MPNTPFRNINRSNVSLSEDFDMMVSTLIKDPSLKKTTQPIKKIAVRPTQQTSIPLGKFDETHVPKGFCVEIDPDPDPDYSVVSKILTNGPDHDYSLTLVVANFGNKTVNVRVWSL